MKDLFNRLCAEVEILRGRESELVRQAEIAQKRCFNSRVDRNTYLPLDIALYNYDDAMKYLEELREDIKHREALMQQILQMVEGMVDLPERVAFMRDIQRLPLKEIASITGFEYGYIRNVSSRTKRLRSA